MGNKSKMKKDNRGRNVSRIVEVQVPGLGEDLTEKKVKWDAKRDLAKARQPRTSRDWKGLQEKTIAPRVTTVCEGGQRETGRLVMPVRYNRTLKDGTGVPLRRSPAPKLEINKKRQPWQKKTATP